MNIFSLFLCIILPCCLMGAQEEYKPVEFHVIIPSYNNEKWVIKNLDSIINQSYPYVTIHYINDCSSDQTGKLVDEYVALKKLQPRCKVTHNKTRKGAMNNIYKGVMQCGPKKVAVIVDGDDRLAHDHVLENLALLYKDPNVWLTHGNYTTEPFETISYCTEYPEKVQKKRSFRSHLWLGCQLRTFYAKLFHLIKREDLMWNNEFLTMSSDLALLFPMLEMASGGHIRFIQEPIYIVNTANPLSDRHKDENLQVLLDKYIRSRRPYKALKTLF